MPSIPKTDASCTTGTRLHWLYAGWPYPPVGDTLLQPEERRMKTRGQGNQLSASNLPPVIEAHEHSIPKSKKYNVPDECPQPGEQCRHGEYPPVCATRVASPEPQHHAAAAQDDQRLECHACGK